MSMKNDFSPKNAKPNFFILAVAAMILFMLISAAFSIVGLDALSEIFSTIASVIFCAVMITAFVMIGKKMTARKLQAENTGSVADADAEHMSAVSDDVHEPRDAHTVEESLKREINAMDAPPVVQRSITAQAEKYGFRTLGEILSATSTPEVLKKYIRHNLAMQPQSASTGFDSDGCHVNDDDLYNPEEYESLNVSHPRTDVMLLNGKPVQFKNRKSPFEM